jgi:uncharacterized protein involved in exopolysaccharide biosynthesis
MIQLNLKVEPVKDTRVSSRETRLIDIRFTHPDPQVAAKIVNAIADTFTLSNLERKTDTNSTTGDFLQKRIAELQSNIRSSEERLINYAKNNQILSLDAGQNTVVERLSGLNRQLLEAENELFRLGKDVTLRARPAQATQTDIDSILGLYDRAIANDLSPARREELIKLVMRLDYKTVPKAA